MKITYREATRQALHDALASDPRVFLMGEDVGRYGGSYAVSKGFLDEFGPERIRDAPLSELGFVGAGIGAALGGMRPIVEVMTVNFSLLALDQIVNTAALYRHMSGPALAQPRKLVRAHSRHHGGRAGHGRRRAGDARAGTCRSRSRGDLRARAPLQLRRRADRRVAHGRPALGEDASPGP